MIAGLLAGVFVALLGIAAAVWAALRAGFRDVLYSDVEGQWT